MGRRPGGRRDADTRWRLTLLAEVRLHPDHRDARTSTASPTTAARRWNSHGARRGSSPIRPTSCWSPRSPLIAHVTRSEDPTAVLVTGMSSAYDQLEAAGSRGGRADGQPRAPLPGLRVRRASTLDDLAACTFPQHSRVGWPRGPAPRGPPLVATHQLDLADRICPTDRCLPVIGDVLSIARAATSPATYVGLAVNRRSRSASSRCSVPRHLTRPRDTDRPPGATVMLVGASRTTLPRQGRARTVDHPAATAAALLRGGPRCLTDGSSSGWAIQRTSTAGRGTTSVPTSSATSPPSTTRRCRPTSASAARRRRSASVTSGCCWSCR